MGSVLQDIDTQMVASVVEDEMLFGLENFGVPHDQIEARIAETLETVGISDLCDREIATLSGGQKQKVAIAAILALQPHVLVLDEPTAALDPASSFLVFDTLRHVNEAAGVTVVVIEQKVALLSKYCNRVVVLDHGRLALEGTPHEVFSHGAELRRIGVDSPRVARISNSLAERGVIERGLPCLSVSEAEALVVGLVGKGRAGEAAGAAGGAGAAGHGAEAPAGVEAVAAGDACATGVAPSPHAPARPKAEGAEPVVSFRGVNFAYPNGGASVCNLELSVYPGELVGIVGQNGAGKTTLTKLLNGLLKPSSGEVRIAGLSTAEVPTSKIAAHCATLFQNPDRQLCKDTVLDEVAFGLELQGVDAAEARRRASVVVERFGLPANESPFSLSRGQRQMVALASVVVIEPDVIVLDEPTSGLDYRECMTVMETVCDMAQRGCAVIMVCHDMEVVSDFALTLLLGVYARVLPRLTALLKLLVPLALIMLLLQTAIMRTGDSVVLWMTTDGLDTGGKACLRLLGVALPLILMLTVTKLNDLANACVEKLHIPYRYAFTFTTALRFVPVFSQEMNAIMEAQTARGVEYDTKNPFKKMQLMLPLCVPLLVSSVGKTDATALAAEQRGFYLRNRESSYKRYPFAARDIAVFVLCVALIAAGVVF